MKSYFILLLIINIANCIHIHANERIKIKYIRDLGPMPIADVEVDDDQPLTAAT